MVTVMTALEAIYEDLKALTPDKLPQAAEWIHELRERSDKEKQNAFDLAFGCLSAEEGEAFAKAVEECERIDEEI